MSTLSPALKNSSPFRSWKFDHAAIRVPDLDTVIAWYVEKLDLHLIKTVPLGKKMYGFLCVPGVDSSFTVELIAGPGAEPRPACEDLGSSLNLSGLHHMAFRVESTDDAVAELRIRNVTIVTEPHDVPKLSLRLAFFADPWGNIFELILAISSSPGSKI